jgi:hypothetical protein
LVPQRLGLVGAVTDADGAEDADDADGLVAESVLQLDRSTVTMTTNDTDHPRTRGVTSRFYCS